MHKLFYYAKQAIQGAICGLPIVAPFVYYIIKQG